MRSEMKVLDNAEGLSLSGVSPEDLDALADCTRIKELDFSSSRGGRIDLGKLAHIEWLECLYLERVKITNLEALQALPKLHHMVISRCKLNDLQALSGFTGLVSLVLRENSLKAFPADLNLPKFRRLLLNDNPIADANFLHSLPQLRELSLRDTKVGDLSPLANCRGLEELDLRGIPATDLSPLKGLTGLLELEVDEALQEQAQELGLQGLDGRPRRPPDAEAQARRKLLFEKIAAGDAAYLNGLDYDPSIGSHIWMFISSHYSKTALEKHREPLTRLLGAVDERILGDALSGGLGMLQANNIQFFNDLFAGLDERLPDAALYAFEARLARGRFEGQFEVGLLKNDHWNLARILGKVASPEYTKVYQRYLDERVHFSHFSPVIYNELLKSISKTKDHSLVTGIIGLIPCERLIIGGDPPLLKKCFKAIASLGNESDRAALQDVFDSDSESRPDVVKAYEDAVARLGKKKAK